jgi:prostaglandin-endoperoxide synthase 2
MFRDLIDMVCYQATLFLGWVSRVIPDNMPWLWKPVNRLAINRSVNVSRHRPHPWSTAHDYISWVSLSDKQWSVRHLPVPEKPLVVPDIDQVTALFRRNQGQRLSAKSTCLFPAFAQYLTDGFIRTRMPNTPAEKLNPDTRKQNTSNHDIDLSPLYGRNAGQTHVLRLNSAVPGERGRLKSQWLNGEEFAVYLFEDGKLKEEFTDERRLPVLDTPLMFDKYANDANRIQRLFAFGGDRANASPQVAMMNTLFLREHNRLAGLLEQEHPEWDDERVFQTARNTNIVLFIKIVVEDYINHISPGFRFRVDPSVAWNASWNKPNWITTEFSLLYRWHALIPDTMRWAGQIYPVSATLMNNQLLVDTGLKQSFIDMSTQAAGEIGAFNTAEALIGFEKSAIQQGRLCQLDSYSAYRKYVHLPQPKDFSDISKNPGVVELLRKAYPDVNNVEFYVGLFAEDLEANTPLPSLINKLVSVDAFSQALTNPLLSEHVWSRPLEVFARAGWEAINATSTLRDLLARNCQQSLQENDFIGMTQPDWKPV